MAAAPERRVAPLLPTLVLGAGACWLLASLKGSPAFVPAAPQPPAQRGSRTALRGFKEDFDAWRSALSPEEKALLQKQAQNEYNKKFRKTDEFKQDLPEEKVQSFAKILGKFFDAESEDYKKEVAARTPDYEGLAKRAGEKKMDFSLKNKVVEVDRDADRRYQFATARIEEAKAKGELFPQSSPLTEKWVFQNDDEESHKKNLEVLEFIKRAKDDPSCPPDAKAYMEEWVKQGIPPMGENMELPVPQVLVNQIHTLSNVMKESLEEWAQNKTEAEVEAIKKDKYPEIAARVIGHLSDKYISARDEIEHEVETMKDFFRSQKDMPGKTKADVLKEIWEELPKYTEKPLPPLDEEVLAQLSEVPANVPGQWNHSWGTADKLYKSEAIDAFGLKYLLGVFETQEEAQKAFADWNAEYEKARVEMKSEMEQWGKQEQARMDRDTSGQERIKKVLEEARR